MVHSNTAHVKLVKHTGLNTQVCYGYSFDLFMAECVSAYLLACLPLHELAQDLTATKHDPD